MSVSQRVAEYAGLFLRHGFLARSIAEVAIVVAGSFLLYSERIANVAVSFYAWYFSMLLAYAWIYVRDKPLRAAFEPAPARSQPPSRGSGRLVYSTVDDKRAIEEQLGLVEPRGRVDTHLLFNRMAVWLAIALHLQASAALAVLIVSPAALSFEVSLFVVLALVEHAIELGMVEALRMYVMATGNEALLLSAVWQLDVEPVHDAVPTRQWTTRDAFIARETGHKEATVY